MKKILLISFLCLLFSVFTSVVHAQDLEPTNKCCFYLEQIDLDQIVGDLPGAEYNLNPLVWDKSDPKYNIGKAEYYYFRFINHCTDPKTKLSIDWEFLVDGLPFNDPMDATAANIARVLNVQIEWNFPLLNPYEFQSSGPLLSGMGLNYEVNPPKYPSFYTINGVKRATKTDFPGQIDVGPEGKLFGYWQSYQNPTRWYNYIYADFLEWACANNLLRVKITRYTFQDVQAKFRLMEREGGIDFQEYYVEENQNDYMGGHQARVLRPLIDLWIQEPPVIINSTTVVCSGEEIPNPAGGEPFVFYPIIPDTPYEYVLDDQYHYFDDPECNLHYVDSIFKEVYTWKPQPLAPIKDSAHLCGPGEATLVASDPYEDDYEFIFSWYSDPTLLDKIHTGKTYTKDYTADDATVYYYVTATIDGCEGPATQYVVRIDREPIAVLEDAIACPFSEYCQDVIVTEGYGNYSFDWSENVKNRLDALVNGCIDLSGECGVIETISVTVTDLLSGCTATAHADITITEEPPTFNIATNIDIYADADCEFDADPTITGMPEDVVFDCGDYDYDTNASFKDTIITEDLCIGSKLIERTWTITAYCTTASKTQVINVLDTLAPLARRTPQRILAEFNDKCTAVIPQGTVAGLKQLYGISDNCTPVEIIAVSIVTGANFTTVVKDGDAVSLQNNYRVKATDDCGNSSYFLLEFDMPETFTVTITTDNDILCNTADNEFVLVAQAANGSGSYSYQWKWKTGSCADCESGMPAVTTNNTITVNPVTDAADRFVTHHPAYSVVVIDNETNCEAGDEIELTLLPLPNFTYDTTPEEWCNSNVKGTITLSPDNYQYYIFIQGVKTPVVGTLIENLIGGIYTVMAEDELGCQFSQEIEIESIKIDIVPELFLDQYLCFSDTTNINVDMDYNANPAFEYEYNIFVPANVMTVNNPNPTSIRINAQGFYWVAGSVTNKTTGCVSDLDSLMVYAVQAPDFTISLDADQICAGAETNASVTLIKPVLPLADHTVSYLWQPSGTTGNTAVINASDPVFSVTATITFVHGNASELCSTTKTDSVTVIESPVFELEIRDETCYEAVDGLIRVYATGGVSPLQYTFDGGTNWSLIDFVNVGVGIYSVGVKDAIGCTSVLEDAVVDGPTDPLEATATANSILCYGDSIMVNVVATGGTPNYTYSYDGVPFNGSIKLPAGSYVFDVMDANECKTNARITLTEPPLLTLEAYITDSVQCYQGQATITLEVQGGTPGVFGCGTPNTNDYEICYLNDCKYTNDIITYKLPANDVPYLFTVTDGNGCKATVEITVTEPTPLSATAAIATTDSVKCYGENATVTVTATGGTAPYKFEYNGIEFDGTIQLPAGYYTFVITDDNGCDTETDIRFGQPDSLQAFVQVLDAIRCNADKGRLEASATGGTGAYTYKWSNGATTAIIDNLNPGTYTVTVTDANNCPAEKTEILAPIPTLVIDSIPGRDVICEDGQGWAEVYVSGGTPNYTYSWNTTPIRTTKRIDNLDAGTYTVTVTDANGCQGTQDFTIRKTGPEFEYNTTDEFTCDDNTKGTITLTPVNYQYYLSELTNPVTGNVINNLIAGSYLVIAEDEYGCTSSQEITINRTIVPIERELLLEGVHEDLYLCYTDDNEVNVEMSYVAKTGFTYTATVQVPSGMTINNEMDLITLHNAGYYKVKGYVTNDTTGCVSEWDSLMVYAIQTPVFELTIDFDTICTGNESNASINITNPSTPLPAGHTLDIEWSTGSTSTSSAIHADQSNFSVTVNHTFVHPVTGEEITCSTTKEGSIDVLDPVTFTVEKEDAPCFSDQNNDQDGLIRLKATGGLPPYEYSFDNGTTWSSTDFIVATPDHDYNVGVKDAFGCFSEFDIVSITAPEEPITVTTEVDPIKCFGGLATITFNVQGGTPGYTYYYKETDGGSLVKFDGAPIQRPVGQYEFVIMDANNCTKTVGVELDQPDSLSLTATITTPIPCYGDSAIITLEAQGGVIGEGYTYFYQGNELPGNTIKLPAGGPYVFTVEDANECVATATIEEIEEPEQLNAYIDIIDTIKCYGETGKLEVFASGGTGIYTYKWSNNATSKVISNLEPGTYSVKITDANNCEITVEKTLLPVEILVIDSIVTKENICADGEGWATVYASGGTGTLTYKWTDNDQNILSTNATATGLNAGIANILVTDANGCIIDAEIEIFKHEPDFQAQTVTPEYYCDANTKGTITLSPTTLQYYLNDLDHPVSNPITGLDGDVTYNVIAVDQYGCQVNHDVFVDKIFVPIDPELLLGYVQDGLFHADLHLCFSEPVFIYVGMNFTPKSGFNYEYNVNVPANAMTITNPDPDRIRVDAAGAHWVSGSVTNKTTGCVSKLDSLRVFAVQTPEFTIDVDADQICADGETVARVNLTKPQPPFTQNDTITYLWSDGTTAATAVIDATNADFWVTVTHKFVAPNAIDPIICETTLQGSVQVIQLPTFRNTVRDITCFGYCDGLIRLTNYTGEAPHQFTFDGGKTWVAVDSMSACAGSYTIGVRNSFGCTSDFSQVTVGGPEEGLTATAFIGVQDSIRCYGDSATITVQGIGGTPFAVVDYIYLYNGVEFNGTIKLPANTQPYRFTVRDAKGCEAYPEITVTEPPIVEITASIDPIKCFDGEATVTVTATGGTPEYNICMVQVVSNICDDQNPATFTVLAGDYEFLVEDIYGCTATTEITVIEPTQLTAITEVIAPVNCYGENATVTVTATEGTAPYKFEYNNIEFNGTIQLPAGNHLLVITDANNCSIEVPVELGQPDSLYLTATITTAIPCNGDLATITLEGHGGVGNYVYFYQGTELPGNTIQLPAGGPYVFTVEDENECVATTTIEEIEEPTPVVVTIAIIDTIKCYGDPATLRATAAGGTPSYTYRWDTDPVTNGATLTNVYAGTYIVTVMDGNRCIATATQALTNPPLLVIDTITGTQVICNDGDGTATVVAHGGTGTLTYSWNTNPVQTTVTAIGLNAGTYTVTVTDANGCKATRSFTITKSVPTFEYNTEAAQYCNSDIKGTITLYPEDGTLQYYLGTVTSANAVTGNVITNLEHGTYTVIGVDVYGCQVSNNIDIDSIYVPINPHLLLEAYLCFSEPTDINVDMSYDDKGFDYEYHIIVPTPAMSVINPNPAAITVNAAGEYWVFGYVKNVDTECESNLDSIKVYSVQTPKFTVSLDDPAICAGSQTTAKLTMITPVPPVTQPYTLTYDWRTLDDILISNSDTAVITGSIRVFNVTVTHSYNSFVDQQPFFCPATLTDSVEVVQSPTFEVESRDETCFEDGDGLIRIFAEGGLPPYEYNFGDGIWITIDSVNRGRGAYTVGVRDNIGCLSETMEVFIDGPTALLTASATITTEVQCYGGTATITVAAAGGNGGYTYSYEDTPFTNPIALPAGTHDFIVKDAKGCETTTSIQVNQPDLLEVEAFILPDDSIKCFGNNATVTLVATGGTSGYNICWVKSEQEQSCKNVNPATFELPAGGPYNFIVTDAHQCTATATITITQPEKLEITATITDPIDCFGGEAEVTLEANGGTPAYTFWFEGYSISTVISLPAGESYVFTVVDANGCEETTEIEITQPQVVTITASILPNDSILCNNGTANVTLAATGGTQPYTYYNEGDEPVGAYVESLLAGTYSFHVIDANGCRADVQIVITQPDLLEVIAKINPQDSIKCWGGCATVTLEVEGGTPGYTYYQGDDLLAGTSVCLVAGNDYPFTVEDAKGCLANATISISQPDSLVADIVYVDTIYCNGELATLAASVIGGTMPYTYSWNPGGATTETVANLQGNTLYDLIVTDANGCQAVAEFYVPEPDMIEIAIVASDTICFDGEGFASAFPIGGTGEYSYEWDTDPVQTTATITNLDAGLYTVTVTDENGCEAVAEHEIFKYEEIDLTIVTTKECDNDTIIVTVTANRPAILSIQGYNAIPNPGDNPLLPGLYYESPTPVTSLTHKFTYQDNCLQVNYMYFIATSDDGHCEQESAATSWLNFGNAPDFYVYKTAGNVNSSDTLITTQLFEGQPASTINHYFRMHRSNECNDDSLHLSVDYKYYYQADATAPRMPIAPNTINNYLHHVSGGTSMRFTTPMNTCLQYGSSITYSNVSEDAYFPYQNSAAGYYYNGHAFSFFRLAFFHNVEIRVEIPGFDVPGIYTIDYDLVTHLRIPTCNLYGFELADLCGEESGIGKIGGNNFYMGLPSRDYYRIVLGHRTFTIIVEPSTAPVEPPAPIIAIQDVNVFPNPANDNITLSFENMEGDATVQIISINGQIVYEQPIKIMDQDINIKLPEIKQGFYFVYIRSNEAIITKKLIIKKDK